MSALAAARRVQNLNPSLLVVFEEKTKASKVFYKGGLVCLDSTGYLVPGSAVSGLRAKGVVDTGQNAKIDTTGQNDGDTTLKVEAGIWPFLNSTAGDQIAQVDEGNDCFIVDDQTVAKTDGGVPRSVAGQIVRVDTSVVWVAIGFPYRTQRPMIDQPSNLVTSGALGITTDFTRLSVTGTVALTLADGTFVGQKKYCRCTVAASTPAGTLTPAHASGFTTISAIDAVGDFFGLEWNGTGWEVMFATGVTVA